jgi:hypothetical protein
MLTELGIVIFGKNDLKLGIFTPTKIPSGKINTFQEKYN